MAENRGDQLSGALQIDEPPQNQILYAGVVSPRLHFYQVRIGGRRHGRGGGGAKGEAAGDGISGNGANDNRAHVAYALRPLRARGALQASWALGSGGTWGA